MGSTCADDSVSRRIDARIAELAGWRGEALARVRALIRQSDAGVFEEWKWDGPVWSHPACGIICTGEAYKSAVKLTFPKGASLSDPSRLFNSSLEGRVRRAIDLHDGDEIDSKALQALVRDVVTQAGPAEPRSRARTRTNRD